MTKKFVVITSIYPPGNAITQIVRQNLELIVVGDKKTPADWSYKTVRFLNLKEQDNISHDFNKLLPLNHYGRKMMGYLEAIRLGAEVIIDTDDDNIPKENWIFPSFDGEYDNLDENLGFVNIYSYYSDMNIWPRGLPLDHIHTSVGSLNKISSKIGVWQGLADGDPDVDAIYRLTNNAACTFMEKDPLVLSSGTISPFNSQNTAFRKELFPLLYLPAYVTFRFTDILRGLIAQPIMWAAGYSLGFTKATVIQERNPHDYTKDFESEIPCYLHGKTIIESLKDVVVKDNSIRDNLRLAYKKLHEIGIVQKEEINLLDAWLIDIENLTNKAGI